MRALPHARYRGSALSGSLYTGVVLFVATLGEPSGAARRRVRRVAEELALARGRLFFGALLARVRLADRRRRGRRESCGLLARVRLADRRPARRRLGDRREPPRLLLSLAAPELLEPPVDGGLRLRRDLATRDKRVRLDRPSVESSELASGL